MKMEWLCGVGFLVCTHTRPQLEEASRASKLYHQALVNSAGFKLLQGLHRLCEATQVVRRSKSQNLCRPFPSFYLPSLRPEVNDRSADTFGRCTVDDNQRQSFQMELKFIPVFYDFFAEDPAV